MKRVKTELSLIIARDVETFKTFVKNFKDSLGAKITDSSTMLDDESVAIFSYKENDTYVTALLRNIKSLEEAERTVNLTYDNVIIAEKAQNVREVVEVFKECSKRLKKPGRISFIN